MESERAEIDIEATPDEVWALIGDFGGLMWMPGVDGCTVEGDLRTVSTMGMEIQERLVECDDAAQRLSYSIVGGPAPVDSHLAVITVTGAGSASHVTWDVSTEPDGTAAFFRDVYAGALQSLKAKVEGTDQA